MTTEATKGSILIVDDEELIRRSIRKKLTKEGYNCAEASCGDDALLHLSGNQADLVILDVMMPGRPGTAILPEIKAGYPDTAVVMATAVTDPKTVIDCMKNGAHDYIPKPFELEEVVLAVGNALMKRRLEVELKRHRDSLERAADNQGKEIRKVTLASFEALVNALEAKDRYTAGHSKRVAALSEAIALEMCLSDADMDNLRWGALLHDVGKIAVDPAIQNKPAKLTAEEYTHMMMHTQIGPSIVEPVANREILEIIRCHHHRYEGAADQPVKGNDIPLGARIVAVADTYDAMTSDRPYRAGLTSEAARAEIRRCSGTQFDPAAADAFHRALQRQTGHGGVGGQPLSSLSTEPQHL
jgi:putative two-component system response regulator